MPIVNKLSENVRREMLRPPLKPIDVVLDTDAKNEIDDQFAIVYALLLQDIKVKAINAAPFRYPLNIPSEISVRYPDPGLGMEASYHEILTILETMNVNEVEVYKGSKELIKSPDKPVKSKAAENIIRLAQQKRKQPLYVVAMGAATNVTSAILMEPQIKKRIVVVWLGGHPTYWYSMIDDLGDDEPFDFNAWVDPYAAMLLFESGVPIVCIPCKNVAEHLKTVPAEIEHYVRGRGKIGNFLADLFQGFRRLYWIAEDALSTVLWDLATIAYLRKSDWVPSKLVPAPKLGIPDLVWRDVEAQRHLCRMAINVKRDPIFSDFFESLEKFGKGALYE